jgi:hypothetical protein
MRACLRRAAWPESAKAFQLSKKGTRKNGGVAWSAPASKARKAPYFEILGGKGCPPEIRIF